MGNDIQALIDKKAKGEMTMNQVYLNAVGDGSFKGSFKDFMAKAQQNGWIDQALNAVSQVAYNKYGDQELGKKEPLIDTPCFEGFEKDADGICQPIKTGMSTGAKIGIGLAVFGVIIGTIVLIKKYQK